MIILNNISKSFNNKTLFQNLNFTIGRGLTIVKGKSGCGKSTLGRIILQKEKPENGNVIYEKNYSFSFLTQTSFLLPDLTIKENISYLISVKQDTEFSYDRFKRLIELFGLSSLMDSKYSELSDGEKRLFSFSVIVSFDSDFYVFDEPLAMVDSKRILLVVSELLKLSDEKAVIVLLHEDNLFNGKKHSSIDLDTNEIRICDNNDDIEERKRLSYPTKKCSTKLLLKANKNLLSSSFLSFALLLLTVFCSFLTVSFSPRSLSSLDDFQINNTSGDYYRLQSYSVSKDFEIEEEEQSKSLELLNQNKNSLAVVPFLYSFFHPLFGDSSFFGNIKIQPMFIIDSEIVSQTMYFYKGTSGASLDVSRYATEEDLDIRTESEDYSEKSFSNSFDLRQYDRFYLSLNMFSKLVENGIYENLYDTNGKKYVDESLGISTVNLKTQKGDEYVWDTYGNADFINVKIVPGKSVIGLSGIKDKTPISFSINDWSDGLINVSREIYLQTSTYYQAEDTDYVYLSEDVLFDILYKTDYLSFFSGKEEKENNRKYGFYYSGILEEYKVFSDYFFKIGFPICLVLTLFFFFSSLLSIYILVKKDKKINLLSSLKAGFVSRHMEFLTLSFLTAVFLILFLSLSPIVNSSFNLFLVNLATGFNYQSHPEVWKTGLESLPLYFDLYPWDVFIMIGLFTLLLLFAFVIDNVVLKKDGKSL